MSNGRGPLAGIRVIDLATYAAGPCCSRTLADWGADVIKVEAPSGDPFRHFGRFFMIPVEEEENIVFEIENANKRGIVIDLKTEEGKKVLYRLLDTADVLVTNYRPNALKKLGLDYKTLASLYPRLIYGYINGYGGQGPDAGRPGFDVSAYWARAGIMSQLGEPDAPPLAPWPAFGDHPTGVFLAGGIAAALVGRERTGRGDRVDVALYHSAIWNMGLNIAACNYHRGGIPKKSLKGPGSPVNNTYLCKDGRWICIMIIEYEKYWGAFCKTLGREDLADDRRYNNLAGGIENSLELIPVIEEIIATRNRDEWVKLWTEADLAFEIVQDFHEVLNDGQALANRFLTEVVLPKGTKCLLPTTPVCLKTLGPNFYKRAPKLGEHTREVLGELGYSDAEIEDLSRRNIIRA